MMHCWSRVLLALAVALALAGTATVEAQSLAEFEKRTTVHTLKNGWTFIIVERPDTAPVFSFATQADVGSAQEVPGITGLAHMFEHMAFKGTPNIGTTDYEKERVAIEEMEKAYRAYQTARLARDPDKAEVDKLRKVFEEKQAGADRYVVPNAFGEIIEREGGVGLNAGTGADSTVYFYSLPANKVELFAYLESERFQRPVFREFYKERDVVMEERRLRTDSQPIGRLVEKFIGAAFSAHPYHQPVIGYMSDLQTFTLTDAEAFYQKYYRPANMVTVIVGNIKAAEIVPTLDKYFERVPAGPKPPPVRTVEPEQTAELVLTLRDRSQPFYLEGYHKPAGTDPDEPIYDALADILGRGRTSRLYKSLVRDQKVAVGAQAFGGFPGAKYSNLFTFYIVSAVGVPGEKVQGALRAEIEKIKTKEVTDEELERFKTRWRADLVRSLNSNSGLAGQLAAYQTLFGDWREMFRYVDRVEKVTKADIKRVASAVFKDTNRTVGQIVTEGAETETKTGM
ncbi:MAG: M16 family metallopeptidase [Vicinamibacteraceae bacterium]